MGVKNRTVKAHELRHGDIIVHAKTGDRYTFVAHGLFAGRIMIREVKEPSAFPLMIRCESDQDVLVEMPI